MATFLRNLPLLAFADVVFDAEVSVGRGGQRELSERRLASGATILDHSRRLPRTFRVRGAVSAVAQPQAFGRPGAPTGGAAVEAVLSNLVGGSSRLQDFEQRLDALLDDANYREGELVSKVVGRVTVALTDWSADTTAEDGSASTYELTFREVLRAPNLRISGAVPDALALTGRGGSPQPGGGGPTQATPGTLDVVP